MKGSLYNFEQATSSPFCDSIFLNDKSTIDLTDSVSLGIHRSLSHFQSYLHLQLPNKNICIWMPMGGGRRAGSAQLCLLEITTAVTGAVGSLQEVEDESLLTAAPCGEQVREKRPRGSSSALD